MTGTLLTLGHGYTARALSDALIPQGWRVLGSTRDPARHDAIRASGAEPVSWDPAAVAEALKQATHLLVSAGPQDGTDPVLALVGDAVEAHAPDLHWMGYLSTTGVYGDHYGAWVDEATPLTPAGPRGEARVAAEAAWGAIPALPLHVFRLAGIYGPGRGPFRKLRAGTARRIVKPGQVFSRIHVDDIAAVLAASIARPNAGSVYNVCDDEPAPPQDVIGHAADLLGIEQPPEIPFAQAELSPMARSFYSENKRVANDKIKEELGVALRYPTYREGLAAVLAAEDARARTE